jgi:hypothetical protein
MPFHISFNILLVYSKMSASASWTNEKVGILIDEYKKVAKNSTAEGGLKKKDWAVIVKEFNLAALNCNYDKKSRAK